MGGEGGLQLAEIHLPPPNLPPLGGGAKINNWPYVRFYGER